METPRIDELIAQVVAWHNRHRLARPITSAQVRSIGVVVLPFVAAEASNATVSAPGQRLVPAFSEDFIAPLTPQRVASFAAKHGSRDHPGAADWSQRVVPADAGHESAELALIYLRTACIELGEHRCRVLIGAGQRPRIIGPRAWSVPRIAGASAAATMGVASTLMAMLFVGTPPPEVHVAVAASTHPVSAAVPASGSAMASTPASAAEPVAASDAITGKIGASVLAVAASAPAPAASAVGTSLAASAANRSLASSRPPASAASSTGLSATPRSPGPTPLVERTADAASSRAAVPVIRPVLSSEDRAVALLEGKRLRAMTPADPPSAAAPGTGPVYAVMTVATRTRALAERSHLVMDSSATAGELPGKPRSELMRVAEGWRAVLWPFRSRDDAKLAQAMLSERGIRTDVLEF
jgi:hypothetical protein